MRFTKFLLVTAIILVTGVCALTNPILFPGGSKPAQPIDVNKDRLYNDVKFLVSTPQPRNNYNIASLNIAAEYILAEFKKTNGRVEEQKYKADGKEYRNIICSFGPEDGERIIVGAHYDVCDEQAGADDNASGVTGILEISRLLSEQKDIRTRIDLVAYTLEEPPHFRKETMGSAVHAKYLHDNNIPVKAMISVEMIGYFSDEPKSQEYPLGILKLFYPTKANYIAVVGKIGQGRIIRKMKKHMRSGSEIDVRSINAPAAIPGIDFSDHLNYWKYGYDALMITDTSFYRNKNYHEKGDTIETLDFTRMAEVVKGIYNAINNL
jgi:hypothetical protein